MKKAWIVFLSVLGGLLLIILFLLALLQTGWVHERLRAFAVSKLEETTGWYFEIERLGGDLLSGVTVKGVRISQSGREQAIAEITGVDVKYNLLESLRI